VSKLTPKDIFRHSSYRLQVRDIFAMYNHEWDILGEIIQNAIDSVTTKRETLEAEGYQPQVQITYDLQDHAIAVRDNGLGIAADEILKILAPHFSGKEPTGANRGEFGVGLAFAVFASNEFFIESCFEGIKSKVTIKNAYEWSMNESDEQTELEIIQESNEENSAPFTKIWVKPVRFPLFSKEKLSFVLQRYTAIGDFWAAYHNQDGEIEIRLDYIDRDGNHFDEIEVKNRLWHPADHLQTLLDYDIVDYLTIKAIDEGPRNAALPNYIGSGMVYKDKVTYKDQEFAYYALMCYSSYYSELAEKAGIMNEGDRDLIEAEDTDPEESEYFLVTPEVDLYPGIFVCKKSMPLGADIPRPPRSGTSNWAAFYIVIHSDKLRTEPGRKKLNIEDERLVQYVARSILKKMDKLSLYVISRVNPDTKQEAILRTLDDNRRKMTEWKKNNPIRNSVIKIQTPVEPPNEQTLIALFHELIGVGLLKGYKVIKLSATDTYDGLYDYVISANDIDQRAFDEWLKTLPTASDRRRHQTSREIVENLIVVEFKRALEDVIADFLNKNKYHTSIKLLVAWDANEEAIKRRGWLLQKQTSANTRYYGANYVLRPSSEGVSQGILSTHVLLIKRFIDAHINSDD
jgi:hypothetical protein